MWIAAADTTQPSRRGAYSHAPARRMDHRPTACSTARKRQDAGRAHAVAVSEPDRRGPLHHLLIAPNRGKRVARGPTGVVGRQDGRLPTRPVLPTAEITSTLAGRVGLLPGGVDSPGPRGFVGIRGHRPRSGRPRPACGSSAMSGGGCGSSRCRRRSPAPARGVSNSWRRTERSLSVPNQT